MWKGIKHLLLRSSTLHLNGEPTQSHKRPRIIMVKHSRVTSSTFKDTNRCKSSLIEGYSAILSNYYSTLCLLSKVHQFQSFIQIK